jgi:class 3 adenylate cyclase/tetratricopeptide (TPR) repeat protein
MRDAPGSGKLDERSDTERITFVLTDVQDSVHLWEQAPEAMRLALTRHDVLIEDLVVAHGGRLVRPRGEGDSRFAVFGRAGDATRAALEIQRMLVRENWPTPEPLRVRMAIHSGMAEQRQGDYYGTDVNRCARLRGLAHGGQIVVSDLTARLVQADLPQGATLESLGEYRLRGLNTPERVFQLGHAELPTRFPPLVGGELVTGQTPFTPAYPFPTPHGLVGRDGELRVFDDLLHRGRADGQVVFVAADAGTGKSALIGTVIRRARDTGFVCLAGGCYESEAVVPLRPFRDALVDYVLSFPAEVVRAELGSTIVELAEFVPELRYHVGLPEQAAHGRAFDQTRLFSAIHSALRYLAAHWPVVLCFEDLHVADAATLDLIQFLARQSRRLPVVLIGSYRKDELKEGHRLAHMVGTLVREGAQQITLAPLGSAETEQIIKSLLNGEISRDLKEDTYRTTEGVPFFIEQYILALREADSIDRRGGTWRTIRDPANIVSPIAREFLQARLGRLSEECLQTLSTAAVLGQSVDHGVLLAVCGGGRDADLIDSLDEALSTRILRETATGYAFTHALLRETLYQGISAPRRMSLHAQAARSLEQIAARGIDRSAELAYHYCLSGSDPAYRAKALHYSMMAGVNAQALSSHRDALIHFSHAVSVIESGDCGADSATRLGALRGLGQAQRNVGQWQACCATFEQLVDLASDPVQRAHAYDAIGRARAQMGNTVAALAAYHDGLAQLDATTGPGPQSIRMQLLYDLAFCDFIKGRFQHARQLGHQMLESARTLADDGLIYRAHSVIALSWMHQANFRASLQHFREALAVAERADDKMLLAVVVENMGAHAYLRADFDAARVSLNRSIELYHECVSEGRAVLALQLRGSVELAEGELEHAYATVLEADGLAVDATDRLRAECDQVLGSILAFRGDHDEAKARLLSSLAIFDQAEHTVGLCLALCAIGQIEEEADNLREAERLYRRAMTAAAELDPCPVSARAMRHLGRCCLKQGAVSEATRLIRDALNLVRTFPESLECAPTLLAHAELLAKDNLDGALRYAEDSLESAHTAEAILDTRLFLATAYAAVGAPDPALRHLQAATTLAEHTGSLWQSRRVSRTRTSVDAMCATRGASKGVPAAVDLADTPLS